MSRHASYTLTCMLNSWPLPRDSATYGSGPRVADAAVIGGGAPPAMPPPGPPPVVPPSAATPAGHAGPPPSDGKSDSSKVMGASGLALPPPPCVVFPQPRSEAAIRRGGQLGTHGAGDADSNALEAILCCSYVCNLEWGAAWQNATCCASRTLARSGAARSGRTCRPTA